MSNHEDARGRKNNRRRRGGRPNGGARPQEPAKSAPLPPKVEHIARRYGVVFFNTVDEAKLNAGDLLERARQVDQLNIVIRAEGDMDNKELNSYGKVFAGAAWTLIHERRVQEGWYDEPR